jgi:hypothetical protein
MTKPHRSIAALLVAALLLAGCGRDGQPGAARTGAPDDAQLLALGKQVSQCVRDHGVAGFPDPYFDGDGQLTLPQFDAAMERSAAAALDGACRDIRDRLDTATQERSGRKDRQAPPMSAEDLAKLRQYTQCMREHGLPNWPDPDATGTYHLRGLGFPEGLGKGDRPIDATFHAALRACEPLAVNGTGISD